MYTLVVNNTSQLIYSICLKFEMLKTISAMFCNKKTSNILQFQALVVPSVAFEPRFQGAFRYLQYSTGGMGPEKQEMMAYKVDINNLLTL